tara:strand:+ start:1173 stop:1994 length:822 start_codon:yes stop_codon:yes gene_type:complete
MKKLIIIGLSLFSINTFSQDYVYKGMNNVEAKIGLSREENTETSETVSADCYDPSNVGQRISAQGCDGLLIVDNTMLVNMVNNNDNYSDTNIFTGQVTTLNNLFTRRDVLYSISNWDTSNINSMENVFYYSKNFNQNINNWNISNVTTLRSMFYGAESFNQPLDKWDVSNVTDFYGVFLSAKSFNQPLNMWNTESLVVAHYTFANATSFNQPLNNWKMSNAQYMQNMFSSAWIFEQDISNWCVPLINSKPIGFDSYSGFDGQKTLQPNWGTCP